MTRALSIVVALLAFCTVLTVSAAYAAPVAHVGSVAAASDDACVVAPAPALTVSGKFCVKRHTLGLPCMPMQGILPVALVLHVPPAAEPAAAQPMPGMREPGWARHFRPPRLAQI